MKVKDMIRRLKGFNPEAEIKAEAYDFDENQTVVFTINDVNDFGEIALIKVSI